MVFKRFIWLFLAGLIIGGTFIEVKAEGGKMTTTEALKMAKEINNNNPYLLTALAEQESSLRPWVVNGECIGLCQVNPKWWGAEISELGINDLYDARQNMTLANKILSSTDYPIELKLMLYNMKRDTAFSLYKNRIISDYAKSIIRRSEELRAQDFLNEVNEAAVETEPSDVIVMNQYSFDMCGVLDCRVLIDNELEDYEWQLYIQAQRCVYPAAN